MEKEEPTVTDNPSEEGEGEDDGLLEPPANDYAEDFMEGFAEGYAELVGEDFDMEVLDKINNRACKVAPGARSLGINLEGIPLAGLVFKGLTLGAVVCASSLTHLGFRACGLGPTEVDNLCTVLQKLPRLQHLCLADNKLGPEVAIALGGTLQHVDSLCELYMGKTEMGDAGFVALATALVGHPSLSLLDVSECAIVSPESLDVLQPLVEASNLLVAVCMRRNAALSIPEGLAKLDAVLPTLASRYTTPPPPPMNLESATVTNLATPSQMFDAGKAEHSGRVPMMRDAVVSLGRFGGHHGRDFFAVLDGHGEGTLTSLAGLTLAEHFLASLDKTDGSDVSSSLELAFKRANDAVRATMRRGGVSVVAACISDTSMVVANVGNTRAVMGASGVPMRLSVDDTPSVPAEAERIHRSGFPVVNGKIGGKIAVSRALGDPHLEGAVSAVPHICEIEVAETHTVLVLASDGVLDHLSDDTLVMMAEADGSAHMAARRIMDLAYKMGSDDNIAVSVVVLDDGKT